MQNCVYLICLCLVRSMSLGGAYERSINDATNACVEAVSTFTTEYILIGMRNSCIIVMQCQICPIMKIMLLHLLKNKIIFPGCAHDSGWWQ